MMIDNCLAAFIVSSSGNQTNAPQNPGIPDLSREPWVIPLTSDFLATSASQNASIRMMAGSLGIDK